MIEIKNLSFGYRKQEPLFNYLSLNANEGQIVGLLGKNGAGKTTLLKLLAGLLACPNKCITVNGHNPSARHPDFLNNIYFLSDEPDIPSIRIHRYVKAYANLYPLFDHQLLAQLLADFQLDATMKLGDLSMGQRKKFVVAFALATRCGVLVFDEPTNGLDIPSKASFRKTVAGALSPEQLLIISTHQVKDVETLIDSVVILNHGKVVLSSSLASVTDKYAFATVAAINPDETLYHEVAPGGFKVIKPISGHATDVDLELLFNAVINGVSLNL